MALCVATYIGVTRIQDNAHRPVDIIAGAVIGISFAVITVLYISIIQFQQKNIKISASSKTVFRFPRRQHCLRVIQRTDKAVLPRKTSERVLH